MAPKKAQEGNALRTQRGEVLRFKSPAEFFSENKNIAGFDNPGKSLYTTIRELVENSLDACESISVLPDIEISIRELDGAELNRELGVVTHARLDSSLFESHAKTAGGKKKSAAAAAAADAAADAAVCHHARVERDVTFGDTALTKARRPHLERLAERSGGRSFSLIPSQHRLEHRVA